MARMRAYGTLAREMRERRFERGDALSTPWIIAVKIRVTLAALLRQLDPDVLTDDARRFLEQTALFGLPEDPALPPRRDTVALLPAPVLTGIVRAFGRLPQAVRPKFVAIMSAVATALADAKD
jgi:hypothetical protein